MAQFRRQEMSKKWVAAAMVLGFGLAGEAAHARHHGEGGTLSLTHSGTPGSLTIANRGSAEIQLMSAIKIEQKSGEQWRPIEADFSIVADCAQAAKVEKCFRLAPQASFKVVPWTGFSCSGQCNQSCRANVKYPPGMYRFVVTSCVDSGLHYSEPFEMRAARVGQ